ncbi:MAG: Gfo/Idh/MocA family oxidoreductase [bacterium]|nr:Gfo/Idh/MocA family oxidoreductase [bacterium]
MKPFRAVLLGLADRGRGLFDALSRDGKVELVAVADEDRSLAEAVAEEAGTTAYADCRQAIVESIAGGLDAVFVALPPFASGEYLRLAAGRELAVFSLAPVARQYEETVELGALFAEAGRTLVVARTWQFEPAYMRLADLPNLAGRVFSAQADVVQQVDQPLGWWGDARLAGGGVLLYGGYELVDAVVSLMGVPGEVFATTGAIGEPDTGRVSDTEDAASVVLRYPDERTAAVSCRRATNGGDWSLTLCGTKATVVVSPDGMTVTDTEGQPLTRTNVRTSNPLAPAVNVFVAALAAGVKTVPSQVAEHYPTAATIRSAYLSAKTGQPESPGRILELTGQGAR